MLKKYQNENTFTTIQHVKMLKHATNTKMKIPSQLFNMLKC